MQDSNCSSDDATFNCDDRKLSSSRPVNPTPKQAEQAPSVMNESHDDSKLESINEISLDQLHEMGKLSTFKGEFLSGKSDDWLYRNAEYRVFAGEIFCLFFPTKYCISRLIIS